MALVLAGLSCSPGDDRNTGAVPPGQGGASEDGPPNPATPMCGVADMGSVTGPAEAPPPGAVQVMADGLSASALVAGASAVHVLDANARTVRTLGLDGAELRSVSVAWDLAAAVLAADPDDNLYLARAPSTVVKLSPQGAEIWSRDLAAPVEGVFVMGTGAGLRVGVVQRGRAGSTLLDAAGAPAGASAITGTAFAPGPNGGIVATDGTSVRHYGPEGDELAAFGDPHDGTDPQPSGAPYHFYQQGGAAVGPDGTIYVADATRGIHATSPEGFYRGVTLDETLGHLTERSWLAPVGDRLYFAAGGRFTNTQNVSWISFADLAALVDAPSPPTLVLGFGAGLLTGAEGQYFKAGQEPSVHAHLEPWWAAHASELRLTYSVRDRSQVLSGEEVAATEVALPTTAAGLDAIPLDLPAARPGAYEIDARLLAGTTVIGATCLHYTVGAPDHRLDFAALPAGTDFGGPALPRSVALADQLGMNGVRARVEWAQLLPQGTAGPMDFSAYDDAFAAAAREAKDLGVGLWAQVGEGSPIEEALVEEGRWEERVAELVTHFRGVMPAWEAWNEPNNTFGSADDYVTRVLEPFARAVRGADPEARVIGGSTLGVDLDYWQGIVAAGGLDSLDVAAIHPYTSHNRSWEEQGTPEAIAALQDLLAESGASIPLWNTESAWWSDGPANLLAQADKAARAALWGRGLGVERWSYLLLEGGYGDFGLSYSLIEASVAPDYVKPAALATMTVAASTAERPFEAMVDTGIPSAYAAAFGPAPGGNDNLLAAWTDDMDVTASLVADGATVPVSIEVTDVLGATSTLEVNPDQAVELTLTGSPVYLVAPAGTRLRLEPAEPLGTNVAAASAGARAVASSANPTNPATVAIDGGSDAADGGDLNAVPAWASAPGDDNPSLTVTLARPSSLDRVVVASHSNASVVTGLRDYTVELQGDDGAWTEVGRVREQFFHRRALIRFPARTATAVRINVTAVNHGGLAGGAIPWFWPSDPEALADPDATWYGPAVVYELEAYGP